MDKKVIVITGPIGSGKSKVLSIINRLGYNTVDLDVVSGDILLLSLIHISEPTRPY